jgi:hypothetical protein
MVEAFEVEKFEKKTIVQGLTIPALLGMLELFLLQRYSQMNRTANLSFRNIVIFIAFNTLHDIEREEQGTGHTLHRAE